MAGHEWPPEVAHLPVCRRRQLPVPFIAEYDPETGIANFGVLDPARHRDCYQGRLCAMCGKPMEGEVALLGDVLSLEPGGFYVEPPVHEACGLLALGGLCPFISRERTPRRPQDDPDGTINYLGSAENLLTVARPGGEAKRPMSMAIHTGYRMAVHMGGNKGGMPVFLGTGRPVRVRLFGWREGRAVEVKRLPVDPERFAATAPRWNCVDDPTGPHYIEGGVCVWCGLTTAQIAADYDPGPGQSAEPAPPSTSRIGGNAVTPARLERRQPRRTTRQQRRH